MSESNFTSDIVTAEALLQAYKTGRRNFADLRGAMLIGTDLQAAILESTMLDAADYDPETTLFPAGFDPQQAGLKPDR